MRIANIRSAVHADHKKISADIDGFTLWFRVPADAIFDEADASAFVVAGLVPCMLLGEPLHVDSEYTVSERLLGSIEAIAEIYGCWNPIFKAISVEARAAASSLHDRQAAFFSGGVDSSYTLVRHGGEIDDLVLINGFDFSMDSRTWSNMVSRTRQTAESFGKTLVPVETNFKAFTAQFGLARYTNFGSVLACIGILLGYRKVFCSSSDTYRVLVPVGSHPLLDPLWSTEVSRLVHTGLEADRAAKLEHICKHPIAIQNLWVCWKDPRVNCGHCSKCVRTAVALSLLGLDPDIFAAKPDLAHIRKVRLQSVDELHFYEEFLRRARARQSPLARILARRIFAYKVRQFLHDCLELNLPASIKARLLGARSADDLLVDINLAPRGSDAYMLSRAKARQTGELPPVSVDEPGTVYQLG